MRTSVDIDEHLLADAMKATGKSSGTETVETALLLTLRRIRLAEARDALAGIGFDDGLEDPVAQVGFAEGQGEFSPKDE